MAAHRVIGNRALLEEEPASHPMNLQTAPSASYVEDYSEVRLLLEEDRPLAEPFRLDSGQGVL